jgi:hypothetical protein
VAVLAAMLAAASIAAQKAVDEVAARHPEIATLEILAARSASEACRTVAATDTREIGRTCDADALALMKSGRMAIDKERDGFDVAVPLHDASGSIIGLVGITFRTAPGQTRVTVAERARQIAAELEKRLVTRQGLFEVIRS